MPSGPKIHVIVSVELKGPLTPLKLQSVGAKLQSPPLQVMKQQVRKKHLAQFALDLGDGVLVKFPAGPGLRVEL